MNITSMTISNFKGIKDEVKIDFKPVTFLFGPNSAGKSTIIQALHYAWEVVSRHNLNPKSTEFGGQAVDLGGFENLVYGHDKSNSITMKFDLTVNNNIKEYADEEFIDNVSGRVDHSFINVYRWNPLEASSELKSVGIEFTISWDNYFNKYRVFCYKVYFNNEIIGIMEKKMAKINLILVILIFVILYYH